MAGAGTSGRRQRLVQQLPSIVGAGIVNSGLLGGVRGGARWCVVRGNGCGRSWGLVGHVVAPGGQPYGQNV